MKDIKTQKSHKMKKKELRAKKERAYLLEQTEKEKKPPTIFILSQKVRNLPVAIEAVFNGEKFPNSERKIQNIIFAQNNHANTAFLKRIFLHFANLRIEFADTKRTYDAPTGTEPIDVLANLARYQSDSLREVEAWKPNSHNIYKQVYSFARHLYAKYHLPAFLDTAWTGGPASIYPTWFIQIGQGHNIRTMNDLPVPLTKKEAHLTMESPKDFNIPQAIRYGQILNLGGDERFVRQILRTRMAVDFDNNEFWTSVFRWLLQHPMLDVAHYAPIVDFIHNQKYVPCRMENGNMVCAQPNMSMKGRDPESMLNQVEAWHKQTGKEKKGGFTSWAVSGFKSFYSKNDRENVVRMIEEICTQKELITEGRTMKHCVGSYAGSCAQGRVSIWKFEEMSASGIDKRLTIEVSNRDRSITQARGKYNAIATASDKYWLNAWAREAGLSLSRYMI